jgi:vitamin-K-epoxide reductase (warfarin-sensitive)
MQPAITKTATARRLLLGIALFSLAGMVVASISLYHHYGKEKSSYCDFAQNFNCDIVNRSIYSEVGGVPVALIGLLGYCGLLALATVYRAKSETPKLLLLASLIGLGFALYLTYIEKYVLAVWCILCLWSLVAISGITVLSVLLVVHAGKPARTSG